MSEGFVDPIAERLMDAQSRFDHRSAETKFNEKGYRTRTVWKGNHHKCDHTSGICDAVEGWIVSLPALERSEYPFRRVTIEMNMERRAQGGQVVEYPAHLDLDDEPLYRAKGMLNERDVKDADKLRASSAVEAVHRTRHIRGLEAEMKHNKAAWADIEKAKADADAKFEAALSKKPAKVKG